MRRIIVYLLLATIGMSAVSCNSAQREERRIEKAERKLEKRRQKMQQAEEELKAAEEAAAAAAKPGTEPAPAERADITTGLGGKVKIEKVENVSLNGMTSCELQLLVSNSTRYRLSVQEGRAELLYNGSKVGTVTLDEPVSVAKRSTESVTAGFSLRLDNPLAALSIAGKVKKGDFSNMTINVDAVIGIENRRQNISFENIPLSAIIDAAGVSL